MHLDFVFSSTRTTMQLFAEEKWKESLWDCCHDREICCCGFFCCCCLYGQNMAKIDQRTNWWKHSFRYGFFTLVGCCWLLHGFTRARLRQRYGLEEGHCNDCCATCFCPFCAICQEAREIRVRGFPPPPIIIVHPPALSISTTSLFD